MNLDKVLFNNLGAMEPIPGFGDNALVRVPERIRNLLNDRARFVAMESVGVEIQFVTEAPNVDVYISSLKPKFNERGIIHIYRGNFLYRICELEPGKLHYFRLNHPVEFNDANKNMLCAGSFSPNVWRIVCDRSVVILHGIDTHGYEIRPPFKEELPSKNWLAYGSSITNSSLQGYPFVAAKRLDVQVQNKGLSGACHIEKAMVDYMFDELEFDFITCELGVNMRGRFTPEEFEQRARYLVERIKESKKPAALITTFPNRKSLKYVKEADVTTEHEEAYNNILKELVAEAKCENLHLINGDDVLTDVCGLNSDLLHPNSYGHAIMGLNLAEILKKIGMC